MSQTSGEDHEARLDAAIRRHAGDEGPLLPILHAVQAEFGCVDETAKRRIAEALNLSRAEVHGVVSFYHDFRAAPEARPVLKLCRAEACQARGSEALAAHAERIAGGRVKIEKVYCLGLCSVGPSAMVGEDVYARLDAPALSALVAGAVTQVRISDDALAIACGADRVARRFAELGCEVVRTSSWGMHWLEPLVEVGGVGFGPVKPGDAEAILAGGADEICIGPVAAHPFIAAQTRLTFSRAGQTRPLSLDDYVATGGWEGLERARELGPEAIVAEIKASGLRGRGGAGFPAGIKWETVRVAKGPRKYIVCNADEGDSGTFADRMLMEGDPFILIEGMAIAGLAVGAEKGFVYIRSEYPHAVRKMQAAARLAAPLIAPFEVEIRMGAGAYVCGEETSLLNSLEGKRGEVRAKPPLPAHEGAFGRPTAVNNVLTLAAVPYILARGAKAYADYGMGRSRGTKPIQLAGNIKYGGLFETAFGITLGELVNQIGGGTATGRPVKAVQVGGPLGAYFPPALFDTPFDYEAFAAADGLIGHGGVTVFDDTVDMAEQARFAFEFCAVESCGKCTPCRVGAVRGRETIEKVIAGERVPSNLALVADLCETMKLGSLCALGGFTPYPVMSAITHFAGDFLAEKVA